MEDKTEAIHAIAAHRRTSKIMTVFTNIKAWLAAPLQAPNVKPPVEIGNNAAAGFDLKQSFRHRM